MSFLAIALIVMITLDYIAVGVFVGLMVRHAYRTYQGADVSGTDVVVWVFVGAAWFVTVPLLLLAVIVDCELKRRTSLPKAVVIESVGVRTSCDERPNHGDQV